MKAQIASALVGPMQAAVGFPGFAPLMPRAQACFILLGQTQQQEVIFMAFAELQVLRLDSLWFLIVTDERHFRQRIFFPVFT